MNPASSPRPAPAAADVAAVIARHKIVVAALALAGTALALFQATMVAEPSYHSHAKVHVRPVTEAVQPPGIDRLVAMGTEREIVTSAAVAAIVRDRLGSAEPVGRWQRRIAAAVVGSTQFLDISCRDRTRDAARRCAQATAEAYLQHKTAEAGKNRDDRIANANAALAPINAQIVDATRRLASSPVESPMGAEADATLRRLQDQAKPYRQILADMSTLNIRDSGVVVSAASRPGAPASPQPARNAALGGLLGLAAGLAVAVTRDRFDDGLRGRVDLERYLRAPVLATVPRATRQGRRADPLLVTIHQPNSRVSDAYRSLRTRVLLMAERHGLSTVMVTSPNGEDGRSAIAANLAVSLAQTGKRVALLSADLRDSTVHEYFRLANDLGLSNVLAGEIPAWEAAHQPLERLWVFGSGSVAARPVDLLQSDRIREVVAECRKAADLVIVEAPAAIGASDCLALATVVDGILVVADPKHTDRAEVEQVRTQFDQVGGHVLGAVMSNASG